MSAIENDDRPLAARSGDKLIRYDTYNNPQRFLEVVAVFRRYFRTNNGETWYFDGEKRPHQRDHWVSPCVRIATPERAAELLRRRALQEIQEWARTNECADAPLDVLSHIAGAIQDYKKKRAQEHIEFVKLEVEARRKGETDE